MRDKLKAVTRFGVALSLCAIVLLFSLTVTVGVEQTEYIDPDIELHGEIFVCEPYAFRVWRSGSIITPLTKRYYGVDSYVDRSGPTEWWDWTVCTGPGDIDWNPFDLLVYKNPPFGGSCVNPPFALFPPNEYYYGRITPDGTFLDKNGILTNFPDSDYYHITTLGFKKEVGWAIPPWEICIVVLRCRGPPPPQTTELELYPREVLDLEDPTGTQWHELHPDWSNYYLVTSWEPGVVLSPCDQIDMEPVEPPGPLEEFEVDKVAVDLVVLDEGTGIEHWLDYNCGYWTFDPEEPICTMWNEIWPDQGRCWHLTNWEDDGDAELSFCDYIDMTPMHPYPGPTTSFHVEQVTVTLKLTDKLVGTQRYLEFMGTLDEFQAMDYTHYPEGTMWHEIWPEQGRILHLSSWEDSLILSPSDQIVLFGVLGARVDKLTVAMNLTALIYGKEHIVKFEGSLEQFKKYHWIDPVSTQWHEVNPDYCRQWNLTYWEDTNANGILDYCDHIWMMDKEVGWEHPFHVEALSTSITFQKHDAAVTDVTLSKTVVGQGYSLPVNVTVENQGSWTETFNVTAYYSNETLTPEQWETFGSLGDVNRDGYIDDTDVDLIDAAYFSTPGAPNWNPDADINQDLIIDLLDPSTLNPNYGKDIWTEFNILGGSIERQAVNDLSLENSTTLVFSWNTTGVPYGNYIISAKATGVPREADTADNTYIDGTVVVATPGDVNADGIVSMVDWSLISAHWYPGPPIGPLGYHPNFDINNDGAINIAEISIISAYWTGPPKGPLAP